ncbi:beta-ketoacyl synthase [Calothrix sp. NIES-2100]|uniref:type I polyketide synthase n=1 Tax=Calothrix sp. NIES-2100 TaxID=1954172 RepID=UPI000B61232A|nr:beta-ketoacyl synthase [Calothrix sp. NIES-2100]
MASTETQDSIEKIAIIGMAGRFPGAKNIEEFWQNLKDGVESISVFSEEELIAAGVEPALLNESNYVKAGGVLENIDLFDAAFFELNPKEAEITNPQHRLFLESAWEALENAGYDSQKCNNRIGVYAGASLSNYCSFDLNSDRVGSATSYQTLIGNDKDFLSTRVSYKLNLKGPSITVQTACSSSLVAVSLACQSLLNYQCDMALAGGVSIHTPQKTGYIAQEGGTLSPDGHCYAFDARAKGTVIGNGVGVVVLKRLQDAIADGDFIYATILGSAINNDGSGKVGYTAPSVDGQAEAIAEAMMLADVEPETISYIETHGTGTALGDPIEIAALSQVFRSTTDKKGFCAIGSVKTNIGHLDAAAGVTGLIKTALALKHKLIPPSLNFEQPNPQIDFTNSPFYVNTKLSEWQTGANPRRAGVSSLGMGGTNAHVILEEIEQRSSGSTSLTNQGAREQGRNYQLLVLSAKTDSALETATKNLAQYLTQHPDLKLADVAYTLQVGRKEFNYRRILVCEDIEDAIKTLNQQDIQRVLTHYQEPCQQSIAFMFPGQGAQYPNMGKELYDTEAIFREQVDRCCEILKFHLGLDLRTLIYPQDCEVAAEKLKQTHIAQPALFVIEYALAQLWMSWGVHPQAAIGHSIGEYVAACLAGVFSLEDALTLVAARGRLMQQMPAGSMLAVSLPQEQVQALLNEELSIAASNAPSTCVVAGSHDAINTFQEKLLEKGINCRRLHVSHAFHSPMMESILEPFRQEVTKVKLHPPKMPFISNVTGTWMTNQQAIDPNYWVKHLRQTVYFSTGIYELIKQENRILLEVGTGRTLSTFAKQHSTANVIVSSLPHPQEKQSDVNFLLNSLGRLWLSGISINWSVFSGKERHQRIPLPTYPFERQRYWIERQKHLSVTPITQGKKPDIADWFYIPLWQQSLPPKKLVSQNSCTIIFIDECGLGEELVKRLQVDSQYVIIVKLGSEFTKLNEYTYSLNPKKCDDYDALFNELSVQNKTPKTIVHLWSLTSGGYINLGLEGVDQAQEKGFYSLLFIARSIGRQGITDKLQITVISNHIHSVIGEEVLCPEKATILAAIKIIPQEYLNISCRHIDVVLSKDVNCSEEKLIDQLQNELQAQSSDIAIAYRGNHRWVRTFKPVRLEATPGGTSRLRQEGVYLITGGLGGIGLTLASYLAMTIRAKLVLIGRSAFPVREEWQQWLATHDEQDDTSRKIRKIQELEELGAEILVKSADVADFQQMQEAIAQIQQRFGNINGVIHCAGVPDYAGVISRRTREMTESIMAPKVKGTLVLDSLLQDVQLDFFILCSSLSSILYRKKFSEVGYCAANEFLDAFADYKTNQARTFTASINWSDWQDIGMSMEAVKRFLSEQNISDAQSLLIDALSPSEGIEVFRHIVNSSFPQIAVSTQDLTTLIKRDSHFNVQAFLESLDKNKLSTSLHPRPQLSNAYFPPRNHIEQEIANLWQEVLGVDRVGIHDNFFELGGDSLSGVTLINKFPKKFHKSIPVSALFAAPTVAELAEYCQKESSIILNEKSYLATSNREQGVL